MPTRIYLVSPQNPAQPRRLVDASSQSAAIRHCVKGLYTAEAASPRDIAELMGQGTQVERAE